MATQLAAYRPRADAPAEVAAGRSDRGSEAFRCTCAFESLRRRGFGLRLRRRGHCSRDARPQSLLTLPRFACGGCDRFQDRSELAGVRFGVRRVWQHQSGVHCVRA